jgi:ABC-type bacteriocin/lantibiotic exporter with double-glycine peptidase domain
VAARALGLEAEGFEMDVRTLKRTKAIGVLHIGRRHFVALVGYQAGGMRVADPVAPAETQTRLWTFQDLAGRWSGKILVVRRSNARAGWDDRGAWARNGWLPAEDQSSTR